jgi:hypothetical protein
MGQASASKQRHESCLERSQPLKEIGQAPFSADRIAHQQREKINGFIGTKASTHQTDLMSKGFE